MLVEATATRHEAQSPQLLLQNQGCRLSLDATRHVEMRNRRGGAALSKCRVETRDWKRTKKSRWNGGKWPYLLTGIKSPKIVTSREPLVARAPQIPLRVIQSFYSPMFFIQNDISLATSPIRILRDKNVIVHLFLYLLLYLLFAHRYRIAGVFGEPRQFAKALKESKVSRDIAKGERPGESRLALRSTLLRFLSAPGRYDGCSGLSSAVIYPSVRRVS